VKAGTISPCHPTSARHGLAWYEFDPSWILITILKFFGVAKAIRVAKVRARSRSGKRLKPIKALSTLTVRIEFRKAFSSGHLSAAMERSLPRRMRFRISRLGIVVATSSNFETVPLCDRKASLVVHVFWRPGGGLRLVPPSFGSQSNNGRSKLQSRIALRADENALTNPPSFASCPSRLRRLRNHRYLCRRPLTQ